MQRFCYPATLTRDDSGGYVVTFRDVPEAITQGDSVEEALAEASDALEEAIAGRMRLKEDIPKASDTQADEHIVTLPAETASKAALYTAIRQAKLTKVQLAEILGIDEKEVRRLLDPYHPSKLPRIEAALEALGKELVIVVRESKEEGQVMMAGAAD